MIVGVVDEVVVLCTCSGGGDGYVQKNTWLTCSVFSLFYRFVSGAST